MKRVKFEEFRDKIMFYAGLRGSDPYPADEVHDRDAAIYRAGKIFIQSGLTNNITLAFKLYQDIFAERDREIFVRMNDYRKTMAKDYDKWHRPECPDCGSHMVIIETRENEEGIKTILKCISSDCDTILTSELTLDEWMGVLKKK